MENKRLRTLLSAKVGQTVILARIDGGRGLNSRLAALGLLPNVEITVINNSKWGGPFVISVKDSKVMLGRAAAGKILII